MAFNIRRLALSPTTEIFGPDSITVTRGDSPADCNANAMAIANSHPATPPPITAISAAA